MRQNLVMAIEAAGTPLTPELAQAFRAVPRHLFVPGVRPEVVYQDLNIVTQRDKHGMPVVRSTQPSAMASMLAVADVQPGQRILEIGTGTAYNTAILRHLVGENGRVVTMELDDDVAEAARAHLDRAGVTRVDVITDDGARGYAAHAPYDRIISTSSVWDIPAAWVNQLAPGGLLVTPLSFGGIQLGAALVPQPQGALRSVRLFAPAFIPIQGEAAGPHRHTQIPGSALHVDFVESPALDEAQIHALLSEDHEIQQLPLEIETHNLGMFNYYLLFQQPRGYEVITYFVEEGMRAFGLELFGWGIMSRTSACLVPYGNDRMVHIFGSADGYLTLAEMARRWSAAGQPGLDDYHLDVTPAGRKPYLPDAAITHTRVFVRPSYTYTVWLNPPPDAAEA
jgi:protein-L-isoaspartate(D-aspartate) O-methyltransferase